MRELHVALEDQGAAMSQPEIGSLCGWAFALCGSLVRSGRLRFDERLCWRYGDNDIEWQARRLGGVSTFPPSGQLTLLYHGRQTVGRLTRQIRLDREAFIQKWGRAPW